MWPVSEGRTASSDSTPTSPSVPRFGASHSVVTRRSGWAYSASLGSVSAGSAMAPNLVALPQVRDPNADRGEQLAGERQADPDDVGRVAVDALDEPAAEP